MADFVNKTTKQVAKSVNTPDYLNNGDWLMIARAKIVDFKYKNITVDVVDNNGENENHAKIATMTQTQKDVVDADDAARVKTMSDEALIQARIRKIAVDELTAEGLL